MNMENQDDIKNGLVAYIWSKDIMVWCKKIPRIRNRSMYVHSLIFSYPRLRSSLHLSAPTVCTSSDLATFHSSSYVSYLESVNDDDMCDHTDSPQAEEHGLAYDCPIFPGVFDYCRHVAGTSLTAARCLTSGHFKVAINWEGGWHHAKRDSAAGFCYINDITIAILHLLTKFVRVLYLDLDLHHGDGVEEAFLTSKRVLCVSVHKYGHGFFPGTGSLTSLGMGPAKYHTANVPLHEGITDLPYINLVTSILDSACHNFQPQVIVCQCGADGLSTDSHNTFNLTPHAYVEVVRRVVEKQVPVLLLGGGGYNLPDTAKCWAEVTAAVANLHPPLCRDIPEACGLFPYFGPDFSLNISQHLMKDQNSPDYLEHLRVTVTRNLARISLPPSSSLPLHHSH